MWDDSTHVHYIIFTCSVAILLATPSHTPPASDPLPPPHLPCGPVLAPMGGAAASAATRKPPVADLSAMRGVERDLLSPHNQLLDFGAEPRLDVSGDGLQNLGLLLREGGVEAAHNLLFDVARLFGSQFAVLVSLLSLLNDRLISLLHKGVQRVLQLLRRTQIAYPLVAGAQIRKPCADQHDHRHGEDWNQCQHRIKHKFLPLELNHVIASLYGPKRNKKRRQDHAPDGD